MEIILLLFILLLFSVVFIFLNQWRETTTKRTRFPPGPRGLPLIGNSHQFDSLNPHLFLYNLSKKYGPVFSLKLGRVPAVVISSAKIAKEVFTTNDIVTSNRPIRTGTEKLSYDGQDITFSAYRDYWREMRKLVVTRLLSVNQVNSSTLIRRDEVFQMIEDVSKKADEVEPINLSETLINLSVSIICRTAFGKSYRESPTVKRAVDEVAHEVLVILSGFFWADYFPLFGWIDKVTAGMISRLEKCFEISDSFYQELIDEHISSNRPQAMEGDILDTLIKMKEANTRSMDISIEHLCRWNRLKFGFDNLGNDGSYEDA